MHLTVVAGSGYGKSFVTQCLIERNIDQYDAVLILDYCDEYRGLCSPDHGPAPAAHWIVGPKERDGWGPRHYAALLEDNPVLDLARHDERVTNEEWQQICADAIRGARSIDGSLLVVVDEAHFVAPQTGSFPDPVQQLITTGRGSKTSAMWVTQRPAQLEEDVIGNATARFLGGFNSDNDVGKVRGYVDYNPDVHIANSGQLPGLREELHTDAGEPLALRVEKTVDEDGEKRVTSSEWVYSDDSGTVARVNSNQYDPACDHVGAEGKAIDVGV